MVYAQPSVCPENDARKILWDFDIQTDHLISARSDLIVLTKKKKENL